MRVYEAQAKLVKSEQLSPNLMDWFFAAAWKWLQERPELLARNLASEQLVGASIVDHLESERLEALAEAIQNHPNLQAQESIDVLFLLTGEAWLAEVNQEVVYSRVNGQGGSSGYDNLGQTIGDYAATRELADPKRIEEIRKTVTEMMTIVWSLLVNTGTNQTIESLMTGVLAKNEAHHPELIFNGYTRLGLKEWRAKDPETGSFSRIATTVAGLAELRGILHGQDYQPIPRQDWLKAYAHAYQILHYLRQVKKEWCLLFHREYSFGEADWLPYYVLIMDYDHDSQAALLEVQADVIRRQREFLMVPQPVDRPSSAGVTMEPGLTYQITGSGLAVARMS